MPIVGFGNKGSSWSIKRDLTIDEKGNLVKVLNEAMHTFEYSDHEYFLRTIKLNVRLEEHYIGQYDVGRSNYSFGQYKDMLESLIRRCNTILNTKKKYPRYCFDLEGNWEEGNIIIMEKAKK